MTVRRRAVPVIDDAPAGEAPVINNVPAVEEVCVRNRAAAEAVAVPDVAVPGEAVLAGRCLGGGEGAMPGGAAAGAG